MARTKDLGGTWFTDPEPIIPLSEQVENSSVYYAESSGYWYLFTNHIGMEDHPELGLIEYTDAIWVCRPGDPEKWDLNEKAIVLDGQTCSWSECYMGMPTVIEKNGRLAILCDVPGSDLVTPITGASAWHGLTCRCSLIQTHTGEKYEYPYLERVQTRKAG